MSKPNSSSKKKQLLKTTAAHLGCSSCTNLNLSSIFNPKPKPHNNYYYSDPSTTTTTTTTTNTTTNTTASSSSPFMAVEKDSSEPYLDFRASMLQMIVENEIYTREDLRNLLTCFLQLNSPSLHSLIIRAFTDIWNTIIFSPASPPPPRRRRRTRRRRNQI